MLRDMRRERRRRWTPLSLLLPSFSAAVDIAELPAVLTAVEVLAAEFNQPDDQVSSLATASDSFAASLVEAKKTQLAYEFDRDLQELAGCSAEAASSDTVDEKTWRGGAKRAAELASLLQGRAEELRGLAVLRAEACLRWVEERRSASLLAFRNATAIAGSGLRAVRRKSACSDHEKLEERLDMARLSGEADLERLYSRTWRKAAALCDVATQEAYSALSEQLRSVEELLQNAELGDALTRVEAKLQLLEDAGAITGNNGSLKHPGQGEPWLTMAAVLASVAFASRELRLWRQSRFASGGHVPLLG